MPSARQLAGMNKLEVDMSLGCPPPNRDACELRLYWGRRLDAQQQGWTDVFGASSWRLLMVLCIACHELLTTLPPLLLPTCLCSLPQQVGPRRAGLCL